MTPPDTQDFDMFARAEAPIAFRADDSTWMIAEDPPASESSASPNRAKPRSNSPRPRQGEQRSVHKPSGGVAVSGLGAKRQDEGISGLLGNIYDAALDAASWPQILAAIADYVGGQSAGLVSKDTARAGCVVHHQFGFDSRSLELYMDKYWTMDPFAVSAYFPTARPTTVRDYMTHEEYRAGRFYQEWAQRPGWIDAVSVVLDRSSTNCSTIVVPRHETRGPVDDEMSARMALIGPHIRRAFQIGKRMDLGRAEVATFVDVLERLGTGVFLVDAGARIVHANIAGRAILGGEGPLRSIQGRLVARDPATDRILRAAVAAAAKNGTSVGDGIDALALFTEAGEAYVAHLLPLASEAGPRAGVGGTVVAAAFVHRAGVDRPSLPEGVARHFGLTPTELKVLLSIVEMGGAPEVADALGIGDNTVKTHLARLYQKTGTRRQADLVKLVAGYSTPFVSQSDRAAFGTMASPVRDATVVGRRPSPVDGLAPTPSTPSCG